MQRLHVLCLSLLVLRCVLHVYAGNNVLDCCLRTSEKPIPWRIVQDYRMQLVQDGCDIPATVSQIKAIRLCRSVCPAPAPRTGLTPSCESEACEAMKPTLLLCPAVVHRTNPPWDLCQCTALGTAILFSLLPSATVVTEKAASSRARGFLTGVLASRVLSITSATIEAEELI
uniref:C-C motif chemokine ligand 19 n=1 Tax=Gallus gallus TaxID=9031 RepID=A0A8V0Y6W8_CHICK